MRVERFVRALGADFYAGVPDSQLKALCDYLMNAFGTDPKRHVIAANEGNCVALAAGYHLATGKTPVVYMQNSGEGNAINPMASLLSDRVYAIPMIFVIGWRGEPGVHDEPQHVLQGEVTLRLLDVMDVASFVVGADTTEAELDAAMEAFRPLLDAGKDVAFVLRKGALVYDEPTRYGNAYAIRREEAIRRVVAASGDDPVVSTTGKISRELFEIRTERREGHGRDFLTVGSMGHSSSIALGVALQRPERRVWCVDGDGAALMHMGALAVIAAAAPKNLIHIVLNNAAHETVGGMPTVMGRVDLPGVARACGYPYAVSVATLERLDAELAAARVGDGPRLIEVRCALGSRANLGRPTTSAPDNKRAFMRALEQGADERRR